MILGEHTIPFEIRKGIIDYTLKIPQNIKSHSNFMDIIVRDPFSNKGKEVIDLNIIPVATTIQTKLNKNTFKPYEELKVNIQLLDQADTLMLGLVNFEIINPQKGKIYMKEFESSSTFSYKFTDAIPGIYILRSFFNDIIKEDEIIVEKYENIDMTLTGAAVYIKNTGNTDYNKKIKFILYDKNTDYIIKKKVDLEPSSTSTLDLSKEVPSGNYRVKLPGETVDNVNIKDNLGFFKKAGYSMSKITGNIVGLSEKSIVTPAIASLIMVILVLTIIIGTNFSRIKRLIER